MKKMRKFLEDWVENAEAGIFRPSYEKYMHLKFEEWRQINTFYVTYKVTVFLYL
jgi:uncharacterized protein Usg